MIAVNYPPSIKTNFAKLCAVYSLLEQGRLEHNRVGEIARSDWGNHRGKWSEYAKIYKAKQLELLKERNRLRLAIRRSVYSDAQWKALSEEEMEAAHITLFGNRQELKVLPTKATSVLLDDLKAVDFYSLGSNPVDPYEDFTGYTEVDAGDYITVTTNKCDVVAVRNDATAYVYYDFGAGHFGDFEHLLKVVVSSADADALSGFYLLSETYHTYGAAGDNSDGIVLYGYTTDYRFRIRTWDPEVDYDTYYFNAGYTTYPKFSRSSTTATCILYSDAARTSEVDTLSITCSETTYRYANVAMSWERDPVSDPDSTYSVENLDIQEAAAFIGSRGYIIG